MPPKKPKTAYLRTEIMAATSIPKAIIKDSVSYVLMLSPPVGGTDLSEGLKKYYIIHGAGFTKSAGVCLYWTKPVDSAIIKKEREAG